MPRRAADGSIGGPHEIELGRGASGVLIRATTRPRTVWTADGRRHEGGSPDLVLSSVRQLRLPRR
jgi:hypothetical protein